MVAKNWISVLVAVVLVTGAGFVRAQEMPVFDESYWQQENTRARGKVMRGAGLEVIGLAATFPTVMLVQEATEDPRGYTAYALMAGIGTIGALLHGHFSVVFGNAQVRRSGHFLKLYRARPGDLRERDERAYFLWSQQKTTRKVITFGAVLVAESLIALSSGISRSVSESRGEEAGETAIWPAYVAGGIFLPGGIFIIARNAVRLKKLKALEAASGTPLSPVSFAPIIARDPATGASRLGLSAAWRF